MAALLAAAIGILSLAGVEITFRCGGSVQSWVAGLATALPGAWGIGPYAGKETVALAAWLASWALLHFAFAGRLRCTVGWLYVFLAAVGLATTLIWPPLARWLMP